jgi:hypothetical protein
MRKLIQWGAALGAAVLLIPASPVCAQNVLWVSSSGSDGNVCSQTAPCATFQGAINKGSVAQINCLTSGNYAPVTINASIIIDCGSGNVGNIIPAANSAAISIGTFTGTVVLRHLSLKGFGGTSTGIAAGGFVGSLVVEDCMIHDFNGGPGISFAPIQDRGLLQVSNSQIFGNGTGISVPLFHSGVIVSLFLNNVELTANSSYGLSLTGPGVVAGTMRSSLVSGNGNTGVLASATQVFFTVEESSVVANLTYGIQTASAGAVVNVGATTIGGNGTGVNAQQGSLISFGNNQMSANGSNGNFSSSTALR